MRSDLTGLWFVGFILTMAVFAPIAARVAWAEFLSAGERLVEMNERLGK